MGTTNIPINVIKAMMYIIAVDDLQLSQGAGGSGTYRWQDWHWTLAESAYWTSQRAIVEPLLEPYNNKKTITSEQRAQVKQAIKSIREYSNYDVNGHRLILKIAAFGNNHDWAETNIKFGTPLAKKPGKGSGDATELKRFDKFLKFVKSPAAMNPKDSHVYRKTNNSATYDPAHAGSHPPM